ncbi:MAG: hypothetical protein AMXMBFR7_29900 [Planctomycetota bacterium]
MATFQSSIPHPQVRPARWPLVSALAVLIHVLFALIQLPWDDLSKPEPPPLVLRFALPNELPPLPGEEPAQKIEPRAETVPLDEPKPPEAAQTPPPEAPSWPDEAQRQPLTPDAMEKPELPKVKTEPKFEKEFPKEPTPPLPEAPGGERIAKPSTAFGMDENLTFRPENPDYLGDANSRAANPNRPAHLPEGDPYNPKGETVELRELTRPGEVETDQASTDPQRGSVAKEGTEVAGTPPKLEAPTPETKVEPALPLTPQPDEPKIAQVTPPQPKLPEPEPAQPKLPDPPQPQPDEAAPEKTPDPAEASAQSETKSAPTTAPAEPVTPAAQLEPNPTETADPGRKTEHEGDESADGLLASSEWGTPGGRTEDLAGLGAEAKAGVKRPPPSAVEPAAPVLPPAADPVKTVIPESESKPAAKPIDGEDAPRSQPRPETERPKEPELARLEKLFDDLEPNTTPSPRPLEDKIGIAQREGQKGHEGDGRTQHGQKNAVSEMVTLNSDTAASQIGELAFNTARDPELVYLREYFRRVNAKWKAHILASNVRLEVGTVSVQITLLRDGKLKDVKILESTGSVTERGLTACRDGLKQASPHAPFPAEIGEKEELVFTVRFLYR